MHKINQLLEQTSSQVSQPSKDLLTEAGQTPNNHKSTPKSRPKSRPKSSNGDHVDAINLVFAEFEMAYHNQYRKAFPDLDSVIVAKKYWLTCLTQFSPEQIVRAARKTVTSQEYLPSVSTVIKACESALSLHGLPESRMAYLEACQAPTPKAQYAWTHPAVYYAAKASDWFILENATEAKSFAIFEYHYRLFCERVIRGESLEIEIPVAIEQSPPAPLGNKQNKKRMKKLRQELGI